MFTIEDLLREIEFENIDVIKYIIWIEYSF